MQVFDREGDDGKFVSVTIKATDQGDPSLEGVCSFTVEITDVNDNPPLFDRQVILYNHIKYYNVLLSYLNLRLNCGRNCLEICRERETRRQHRNEHSEGVGFRRGR